MAHAVSWLPLTIEAQVRFQASPCVAYGQESGIGMGFSLSMAFPLSYHSNNTPYSFIHLLPTLYNLSK
jgi:hypothetical protein